MDALGNVLPVLQLPLLQPAGQLIEPLRKPLGVARHQEALHLRLLDDQLSQPSRSHLGFLEVVLRDLAADGDPRLHVDQPHDRVGDGPAHVVEVDVDAVGAEFLEFAVEITTFL